MDSFNLSEEVKKHKLEKRRALFKNNSSILQSGKFIAMNPGYYPPYDYLDEYAEPFKNNVSFCLQLLDDIDTTDKTLLDIGCGLGIGIYSYEKYLKLKSIHGIDLVEENIEFCKDKYNGIFKVMDFNNISYEDNSFDIVTASDTLNGLIFDSKTFIDNIYRIMKPGGVFAHIDMRMSPEYDKHFSSVFINTKMIDVTENVILSIDNTIDSKNDLKMSKDQQDLIFYGYKMNKEDALNGNRYIKYIGYKE